MTTHLATPPTATTDVLAGEQLGHDVLEFIAVSDSRPGYVHSPATLVIGYGTPLGPLNTNVPGGGVFHFEYGEHPSVWSVVDMLAAAADLHGLEVAPGDDWFDQDRAFDVVRGEVRVPACIESHAVTIPILDRCIGGLARYGEACPACGTVNREPNDDEVPF
jgi:hypothetical protein